MLVTLEDLAKRRRELIAACAVACGLTPRERGIADLVARALGNRQVARALGVATQTVKNHLKRIFERTGALGRAHLVQILLAEVSPAIG